MRPINFRLYLTALSLFLTLFSFASVPMVKAHDATSPESSLSILIIFLPNGDKVSGTVVAVNQEQVEMENKYAGRLRITLAEVKAWEAPDLALRLRLAEFMPLKDKDTIAKEALEAKERTSIVNAKTPASTAAAKPAHPEAWKKQVNFAYTLTRGNVESSDLNLAFNLARKQGTRQIALTSFGRYGVKNGAESANLLSSTFRYERTAFRLPIFSETQFEIDRQKNLDYRLSKNLGISYPVLKGDNTQLAFDFGTGVTKEVYETGLQKLNATSLLRLKASQKLTEKTLLSQQATVFSDLTDPSAYRIQAEASLTTPITKHLALRLAGINRYDARPQGFAKPNDFTLLTGFTFDF